VSAGVATADTVATDSTAPDARAVRYAGLVTRLIAFAADAAVINGVALLVGVVVGLALSLFDLPEDIRTAFVAVGAAIALIWAVSYFVAFWSTTGQTPGDRVMHIQVLEERTNRPVSAGRALVRVLLLPLSVITLGAGMLLILVSARRRALHDMLAHTVVICVPTEARSPGAPARP
jgi:uncharacterized RDD family membrane protein YckC